MGGVGGEGPAVVAPVVLRHAQEFELGEGFPDGAFGIGGEEGKFVAPGGSAQGHHHPEDERRGAFEALDPEEGVAVGHRISCVQGRASGEGASPLHLCGWCCEVVLLLV